MTSRPLFAATLLVLALTGCGVTPPGTVPGTAPATTPTAAASSSAPVASPSPSASSPSPSAPAPSATPLVLGGTKLGEFAVGAPEATVTMELLTVLGKTTDSSAGPMCELDDSSQYSKLLNFGSVWVLFAAKDAKKTSPRTLFNWGAIAEKKLPAGIVMQDNVPLGLSWKQLKAKYPAAKSIKTGVEGTQALQLPNKLLFTGDDIPLQVQGGTFAACE